MKNQLRNIQAEYYKKSAQFYDEMHIKEGDEHFVALKYISNFLKMFDVHSALDVGCGTGRAIKYFSENHPEIKIIGIEPVKELIYQAVNKNKISPESVICGSGESLSFENASFDIVCAFGVMHHVPKPDLIIKEMMRVAKKAIFISDSNRFGQGSILARWTKLLLYKIKLWHIIDLIKTKGKGYTFSEGDGVAYSYSIFDSYNQLAKWADKIILIPTSKKICHKISWFHPLITSSHVLICAIKNI